ncbi:MAG: response regulator transcription factor [Pseudomonadales bacterium]|nr:response regulator transcription factor [Pseudomonadales bacterium]
MPDESLIYLVDDDEAVRYGLRMLLEAAGYRVAEFGSAAEFLEACSDDQPGCLILDIQMPGTTGLELQEMLVERGFGKPVIFLTGHASVPAAVKALKGGAIDFFQKPVTDEQPFLDRVAEAVEKDTANRRDAGRRAEAQALAATLTPREREVMELVSEGSANKVVAIELGISERTVELHRSHLMKKLGVRSIADLITLRNLLDDD